MTDILAKDLSPRVLISPEIRAVPAIPPIPAWDETIITRVYTPGLPIAWVGDDNYVFVGATAPPVPYSHPATPRSSLSTVTHRWQYSYNGPGTFSDTAVTVHHPAVPGVPAVVGHPAVWAIALNTGWNAGARSIAALSGDGQYQFSVDKDAAGVVTGFNSTDEGVSYTEIEHGLYCTYGAVVVVENGVQKTSPTTFVTSDVFTIARQGGLVRYYKNSTLLYKSLLASTDPVFADASLYLAQDEIINASLSSTLDTGFSGAVGAVADSIDLVTKATNLSGYVGDTIDLVTVATKGPEGACADSIDLTTFALGAGAGVVHDTIDLVTEGAAGLFVPNYAVVEDDLGEIWTDAYGIAGETGAVADSFTFRTFAANGNFGQVQDSFDLETMAYAPALDTTPQNVNFITDVIALSDVLTTSQGRNVVETLGLSTATQALATLTTNVVESVGLHDAPATQVVTNLVETLGLSTANPLSMGTSTVETLTLSAVAATAVTTSYVVETVRLTAPTSAQTSTVVQNVVETLGLTALAADASTGGTVNVVNVVETLGWSDVETKAVTTLVSNVIETLGFSVPVDSTVGALTIGTNVVETLGLSDTRLLAIGSKVVETLGLSVVFSNGIALTTSTAETAGLSVVTNQGLLSAVVETLGVSTTFSGESQSGSMSLASNIAETLALANAYAFGMVSALEESLGLSDTSTQLLSVTSNTVETLALGTELQGGGQPGAWHAHLESFAMSRYTNFGYESMAVVDGVLLGVGEDGIYRLDANDDSGTEIDASVVYDWSDRVVSTRGEIVPEERLKRARYFYSSGTTDGQLSVTIGYVDANGDEKTASYLLDFRVQAGFMTNRAVLGRGIRSRYLQVTLNNVNGAGFVRNDNKMIVDITSRSS